MFRKQQSIPAIIFQAILLFTSILIMSCTRIALRSMEVFANHCRIKNISTPGKQIQFIPMHHIGTPAYYQHVKKLVDSLHQAGFIICYELLTISPHVPASTRDSLNRKYRKITGGIQYNGYINDDGLLMGRHYRFTSQLVNQPRSEQLGINHSDLHIDVPLEQLMSFYEAFYGHVALDTCDWKTPYQQPYTCAKNINNKAINYLLLTSRDQLIAAQIQRLPHLKIALLYGAKHFTGIAGQLQQRDSAVASPLVLLK